VHAASNVAYARSERIEAYASVLNERSSLDQLIDLRHSYAVASLVAGIHPKVVSERLGHSSITVTLDTYSHVLPSLDESAASTVAALILASTVDG